MNLALKHKLELLDSRLPKRETALLSAEAFICRAMDIPAGTSAADAGGFVQLQLEAASPCPIENLAWGYLSENAERALVFAAALDRAAAGQSRPLADFWHAFPTFLPFCLGADALMDSVRICVAGRSASALFLKAGACLPTRVTSCPLPQGLDFGPTGLAAAKALLAEKLGVSGDPALEDGLWLLDKTDCSAEERVAFTMRQLREGQPESLCIYSISGSSLWNADARGRIFAETTRKNRRAAYAVWLAFCGAGIFAAVLLVAQVLVLGMVLLGSYYRSVAHGNLNKVEELQNEADFAANLDSVTERQMKPFSMLAVANRKRPGPVYFERASSEEWNVMRVEGQAQRADQVQSYVESLSSDPDVREVRNVRTSSTGGKTTFDMEIVFKTLDDLAQAK
jgi:hypothetical protein